jgi:hypothetical protein
VTRRAASAFLACLVWLPLLAGCGPSGSSIVSASPSQSSAPANPSPKSAPPSPSPMLSTAPSLSPSPSPSPSAPVEKITVGSLATVVTNDLRVRSRPEVSDISKKLEPLLQHGKHLFVVKGPVAGSGYRWYEVQPLGGAQTFPRLPFGWVAVADKTGEPWINGGGFVCPATPKTFASFVVLEPLAWVACFGRKSMTFPARLADPEATCGVDPGWTITPEWLASTCPQPEFIVFDPKTNETSFYSVIDPGLDTSAFRPGPETKDWIAVNLTGHFDDKAAPTCKGISTEPSVAVEMGRDEIITSCRATFVITGIKRRN